MTQAVLYVIIQIDSEVLHLWMRIELRSPLPVYEQIKMGIKEAVMRDQFEKDSQIPSIRELAKDIQVNPNTVARAYRELEREGIIFSRPGIGFMINVNKEGIKSQLLKDIEGELAPLVSRMKKASITKEDVNEVMDKLWKE